MQLKMEFFQPAVEKEHKALPVSGAPREVLEHYVNTFGLVAYKDFYMKIKGGIVSIPEGITKENYLVLAREVYESRAARVERQANRSKFFAVRNRIKKQKEGRL